MSAEKQKKQYTYVICESFHTFKRLANEKPNPKDYLYLQNPDDMRGLTNVQFEVWGDTLKIKRYADFMEEIRIRKLYEK